MTIGNAPSLGVRLEYAGEFSDAQEWLATMIVAMMIGIIIDARSPGRWSEPSAPIAA